MSDRQTADKARDPSNRDRLDAAATTWATAMVFSEPLKMLAAAQNAGPGVGVLLFFLSLSQMLGYIYLAARVGKHGGYEGIRAVEWIRYCAIACYSLYAASFLWFFSLQKWLG